MEPKSVKFRVEHIGTGDAIQFSIVLKHVRYHWPDTEVTVEALARHHCFFRGLCDNLKDLRDCWPYRKDHEQNHQVILPRPCGNEQWANVPSTKPTKFIVQELGLEPLEPLYRYRIDISDQAHNLAADWLNSLPDQPYVVFHCEGTSSAPKKDLPQDFVLARAKELAAKGITPVYLTWNPRSQAFNLPGIAVPLRLWTRSACDYDNGILDSEIVATLLNNCGYWLGIDSGPAHIGGAIERAGAVFWLGHHPVNAYDLADNVTHIVSQGAPFFSCPSNLAECYFERCYKHHYTTHILDMFNGICQSLSP